MTELSDELLVAYVDGQLARDQTRAVDKVFEQDEVIARRVDTLKEAHDRLESAFEAILAGEVSETMAAMRMVPPPRSRPRGNGLTNIGLATAGIGLALAALVTGYGWPLVIPDLITLGHQAPQQQLKPQIVVAPAPPPPQAVVAPPTWQEAAARAHALLSRASVEVGLESQGNQDLVAFQVAQAIGPAVKLPNLEAQGLKFMRAQLLRFGDKPLAQMLYLGAHKDPLALYAMRGGGGDSRPVFRQEGAVGSVSWRDNGIAYLLAGEDDEEALVRLAEKIRNEPSAPDVVPPPRPAPQLSQAPSGPASSDRPSESPPTASDPAITGSNPVTQQASPEPAAEPAARAEPAPAPSPAQ
jgi:anti-sigma factor RsiW